MVRVSKRFKIGDGREYEATSQHGQPHSSTLGVFGVACMHAMECPVYPASSRIPEKYKYHTENALMSQ